MAVKVGDKVLFGKYAGQSVKVEARNSGHARRRHHGCDRGLSALAPVIQKIQLSLRMAAKEVKFGDSAATAWLQASMSGQRRQGHPRPEGRNVVLERSFGAPR